MNLQQWLDRLHHELQKRGLPSVYSARLTEELTEHFNDVQMENPSMDAQLSVDETLGSPELLATAAQEEFFDRASTGWYRLRKKFSILTLVMALVATGGWVRSLMIVDQLLLPNNRRTAYYFGSAHGSVFWSRFIDINSDPPLIPATARWESYTDRQPTLSHALERAKQTGADISTSNWCGFCAGKSFLPTQSSEVHFWAIPYWWIVIALTLPSVFLLFVKLRNSNQKKTTANEEAGDDIPAMA